MADQTFDPRLESLLRDALAKEAASLSLTVRADQVLERAQARRNGRPGWRRLLFGQPIAGPLRLSAAVGTVTVLVVAGVVALSTLSQFRPAPAAPPLVDVGIFEPIAGRIVYNADSSLWGIDPIASSPASTLVRLGADGQFPSTGPLGWSSDGTKLLLLREAPLRSGQQPPFDRHLYILHADGTETQVTPEPVRDGAISPDGSRVAFSTRNVPGRVARDEGLFVVDAEGGEPVRIAQEGTSPTFSPDGTQIAYLSSPPGLTVFGVTGSAPVWMVNVDGTGAHEVLADEPGLASGDSRVKRIKWSPAGDRIAMHSRVDPGQEETGAIYTFAPDGSDFTMVITGGADPHWSPDGSQIAYSCLSVETCTLAIADADGSNVRTLDYGSSGPWHPGSPSPSPSATASNTQ